MNDNMKIGQAGLDIIKEFEGYHTLVKDGSGDCIAYLDRLPKKPVWTIGYGCTAGVYEGLRWTRKQAEEGLRKEVNDNSYIVKNVIKVKLNQNQFDALVSFSYNMIGGLSPNRHPTLVNAVNREDWKAAAEAFNLYVNSGGKPYNGLIRRRKAEAKLFMTPVKKEIVDASSRLRNLKNIRTGISSVIPAGGLAEYLGYMEPIKLYIIENPYKIVAFSLIALWLLSKWIERKSVKEAEEGRYVPSGMAETETEDDELPAHPAERRTPDDEVLDDNIAVPQ